VADYSLLLGFAVLFGLVDYATIPVTIALVAHYVGVARMGVAMGVLAAGHSVGGAAGALLGGTLFDLFASYSATWWASAGLALAAAVLVLAIRAVAPRDPTPSAAVA
jgi:predicted MFS family arabinose efflux permease